MLLNARALNFRSADLVCVTHDILVCSKCILTTHRHCRVLDMNDYVKSTYYTSKWNDVHENLKRYKNHLGVIMDEITTKMDSVAKDEESLVYELKGRF